MLSNGFIELFVNEKPIKKFSHQSRFVEEKDKNI